jgi:hypothetical protein
MVSEREVGSSELIDLEESLLNASAVSASAAVCALVCALSHKTVRCCLRVGVRSLPEDRPLSTDVCALVCVLSSRRLLRKIFCCSLLRCWCARKILDCCLNTLLIERLLHKNFSKLIFHQNIWSLVLCYLKSDFISLGFLELYFIVAGILELK